MVSNMAAATIAVITIPPFVSGKCTLLCTPLALITVACMFAALIAQIFAAQEDLDQFALNFDIPPYFDSCVENDLLNG